MALLRTSSTTSSQAPFRLFDLPSELRLRIYAFALTSDQPTIISESSFQRSRARMIRRQNIITPDSIYHCVHPPLLQSSRQLRGEAYSIFYSSNTWQLCFHDDSDAQACLKWLRNLSSRAKKAVKNVRIFGFCIQHRWRTGEFQHGSCWTLDFTGRTLQEREAVFRYCGSQDCRARNLLLMTKHARRYRGGPISDEIQGPRNGGLIKFKQGVWGFLKSLACSMIAAKMDQSIMYPLGDIGIVSTAEIVELFGKYREEVLPSKPELDGNGPAKSDIASNDHDVASVTESNDA
ncbi:MAG: hypothetical protein M1820_007470 [Bogoriella megaspora]|nr:MAG: hypothetical protein M1820_007470 [Bogoriella megaspora]